MAELPTEPHVDMEKLANLAGPIVRAHGCECCELTLKRDRPGWVLRLLLEKEGAAENLWTIEEAAIDLESCAKVSRELSAAFDLADLIPFHYTLEVGSPGLERRLRNEKDFLRFAGKKARVKVRTPIDKQSVFVGTLGGVVDGVLSIAIGETAVRVPVRDIVFAHLVFEFGASKVPAGPKSPAKKRKASTR